MNAKKTMTHAEHEANRLRKQVAGHARLIADLQQALRTFQERAASAEREAALAWNACALLEHIARGAVATLPEEQRAQWLAQFPCLGRKEGHEDGLEIPDHAGAAV